MNISDLGPLGSLLHSLLGSKPNEKTEKSKESSQKNVGSGDTVEISSTAKELQKLKGNLGSISGDFRPEKVEQYRKILESGSYNVNAEKITQKLVLEHLLDTTL